MISHKKSGWQTEFSPYRYSYSSGMKVAVLLLLCLHGSAHAQLLCKPVESRGEGHWPIPEENFTADQAEMATRDLMEVLTKVDGNYMTSQNIGGLDVGPYVMNRLVYIKGYALKSEALEEIAIGDKLAQWSIDNFCTFLTEEAFVWH